MTGRQHHGGAAVMFMRPDEVTSSKDAPSGMARCWPCNLSREVTQPASLRVGVLTGSRLFPTGQIHCRNVLVVAVVVAVVVVAAPAVVVVVVAVVVTVAV